MTAGASPAVGALPLAGLRRRLVSLLYEALLLAAVLLAAAVPVVMLTHNWHHGAARIVLRVWLVAICGAFYVWQWRGEGQSKGQTLPMKTWRMRLTTTSGKPLSTQRALARYAAVYLSLTTCGVGYLWALIDRDRQFLHDRLAGTRLVMTEQQPG